MFSEAVTALEGTNDDMLARLLGREEVRGSDEEAAAALEDEVEIVVLFVLLLHHVALSDHLLDEEDLQLLNHCS